VVMGLVVKGQDTGSCLDFVDLTSVPACYQDSFLCLGEVDTVCHHAENQLQLHVASKGWDNK
jgi:hypothetical protein